MDREEDLESIFGQAERWLARLSARDCSSSERQAFEAWQAADPVHAAAYSETEQLWGSLSALADDDEVASWRREAIAAAGGRRSRFTLRCLGPWAIAASVLIIASLGGYFFAVRSPANVAVTSPPTIAHYATATGEVRQVTLPDGSSLTLNANTALDIRMDQHARAVYLTAGEAVFNVVHEPQRNFTVYAAGNTIRDIGTRFDVNIASAQTDITVIEGVVKVARQDKAATLTLGDQLVAGNSVWRQRSIDPAVATGWTQGKLVFRETPLGEAVAQVNRYGPGRLVIVDPSLESLPISGDFSIGQTASLVRALQSAFQIRAKLDKHSGETRLSRR